MMETWPQLPSIHKAQRTRSGLYQRNTGGAGESRMEGKITASWLPQSSLYMQYGLRQTQLCNADPETTERMKDQENKQGAAAHNWEDET